MYLATIILNSLVWGTQILMVAVGLYLVLTASRIFHLALGAIGAASAYAMYWGITIGWPIPVAIFLGVVFAILLGILSVEILEPFAVRRETLMGLLVSFALGIVIESLIAIFFGTDGKSLTQGILPVARFGKFEIDFPGFVTIIISVILAIFIWASVHFTRIGRLLRSIAENSHLATSLGVNNKKIRYLAYIGSSLIVALVVGLTGWHTALTPLMGFHLIIAAFIALLMGGVSDLRGTVIASYLIAIIPSIMIAFVGGLSENWRLVIVFMIAAVVLILRPNGILSKDLREA
jgi:branched-subunit amino acid ABC-type transport system permease component